MFCCSKLSGLCIVFEADFATVLQRVLLFEAFGLVFCCSRLSEAVVQGHVVFEAFGSGGPRPDFARPKRLFLWIPKAT